MHTPTPSSISGGDFTSLLIVVLLAFVVPLALSRFRILPAVVGEIVAGIVIGQSGFRFVHGDDPALSLLAEIGFAFLMFLSGLEIDFNLLIRPSGDEGTRRSLLGNAGIVFMLTLLLAAGVGWGGRLAGLIPEPWIMTLILSTTSLGIVVPVLKERGVSSSPFGQHILFLALVADFLLLPALLMTLERRTSNADASCPANAA